MNVLDVIMAGLLVAGMVWGYRSGFIRQTARLVGFVIALIVALRYRSMVEPTVRELIPYPLSGKEGEWVWLLVFNMEGLYYTTLSFLLLFLAVQLAVSLIALLLEALSRLPGFRLANKSLGLVMGVLKMGLFLFIVAHLLFFLPWELGQHLLADSALGRWMVNNSPLVSLLGG